jgi:hypothetical protein
VNQRQKSAKIKAGFFFYICIQYNVFSPPSPTFISIHLYLKCIAKLEYKLPSSKLNKTKTNVIESSFCFRVFLIPRSGIFFLSSHPQHEITVTIIRLWLQNTLTVRVIAGVRKYCLLLLESIWVLAVSEEEAEGFGEDCHPSVESTKDTSD